MKSRNLEFSEQASAMSAVQDLTKAIAAADAQIADGIKQLAFAEAMLVSVVAELKAAPKKEHLIASKKAWRASIEAFLVSNAFYQSVVDRHTVEIYAILKRTPEARLEN